MNWCIIGLGKIAHKFASDLQLVKGATLYALGSRSMEKAKVFNQKFPAQRLFDSYEEASNCKEIQAVYIATPHVFHKELSIMFLKKGIAVLCEKPLGMNTDEVKEMQSVARAHNTFLMEAMWTRFVPSFQKIQEIVAQGKIGSIKTIRADFGFNSKDLPSERVFNKELGGGAIMDVGIYPLYLSLSLLGQPDSITCVTTFTSTGVDESSVITLRYGYHQMADLYCSLQTQTAVEASILGETGAIKLHSPFHHSKQISWGEYYSEYEVSEFDFPGFGYQFEIQEVEDCARKGLPESEKMPLSQSYELAKLLENVLSTAGMQYH